MDGKKIQLFNTHFGLREQERIRPNWTLDLDDATQEAKAARPLREARVDVVEDKANPGSYQAVAYLKNIWICQ